jgi:hypothetical protein
MRSHRVDRQEQPPGDLGVGRPAGQQRHDLPLSFRQQGAAPSAATRLMAGTVTAGATPGSGPATPVARATASAWVSVRRGATRCFRGVTQHQLLCGGSPGRDIRDVLVRGK